MKNAKYLILFFLPQISPCFAQSEFHGKLVSLGLGPILVMGLLVASFLLAALLDTTTFKSISPKGRAIAFLIVTLGPIVSIYMVIILSAIVPTKASKEHERLQKIDIEAQARFKELCDTEGGEKTYEKLKGVKTFMIKQNPKQVHTLVGPTADKNSIDPYIGIDQFSYYSDKLAPYLIPGVQDAQKEITPNFETIEEYLLEKNIWQIIGININTPAKSSWNPIKKSVEIKDYSPRSKYALEVENVETAQDRDLYAIAGIRFKITEVTTNKLIATKTIFMRDPGLGIRTEARTLWLNAKDKNYVCPTFTWPGKTSSTDNVPGDIGKDQPNQVIAKWLIEVFNP